MRTYYTSVLNLEAAKFLRNITINEKVLLAYNFTVHFKHYLYYHLKEINPLNPELNPIYYLLALLAHHFLHVSRIRVKAQWGVTPGCFICGTL